MAHRKPRPLSVRGVLKSTPRRRPIDSDPRWYWQVYYSHDGSQHRIEGVPSGRYARPALRAALEAAWSRGDWQSHNAPSPSSESIRARQTVGHLVRSYLAHQVREHELGRLRQTSLDTYSHATRRLLALPGLAGLPLVAPRPRVLQRLLDDHARTYSVRTVLMDGRFLRSAWLWGLDMRAVSGPLPRVKAPSSTAQLPESRQARTDYTPELPEIRAVAAELAGWHRRLYTCLLVTGGRAHELAELRWSQLDFDRDTVLLLGKGKGGGSKAPRRIPLLPQMREALIEQAGGAPGEGLVWPTLDPAENLRLVMRGACSRAEVERFTPHALRRWVACELMLRVFASGDRFSAADYVAWMGHTLEMGLRIYARSRGRGLESGAEALQVALADNVTTLRRER